MISINNVSKSYFNNYAVKDINLEIPIGKVVGIIGANGSGKSTTLKLMSGLLRPSKGSIYIDDISIDRRSSSKLVSFLSEQDTYYSFYTVKETINFYASQFADFDLEKALEILKFMELEPDKKVKHLSKGSRGRLKILLSLSRNVPYIIMDEPLAGLDPIVRSSIIKSLISFLDLGKQTVIITTHEISEVEAILDTVILLRDGNIISIADVEDIRCQEGLTLVEWMNKKYLE